MKKITLMTVAALGLSGAVSAGTIFEATTGNTAQVINTAGDNGLLSLTGATPDLLINNGNGNFNSGGFASTDSINTMNGTALTALDTVTISSTVDSITHTGISELRSRGYEFGMSAAAEFDGGATLGDNLILKLGGGGNSGNVAMVDSFAAFTQGAFTIDPGSMADGFGVTLTANEAGFTFSFTDVTASSGTLTDLTGTFAAGEFATYFGAGHYYSTAQKRFAGTTTLDFSEASVSVIPEPATLGLIAAFGGGILFIRRRFMM